MISILSILFFVGLEIDESIATSLNSCFLRQADAPAFFPKDVCFQSVTTTLHPKDPLKMPEVFVLGSLSSSPTFNFRKFEDSQNVGIRAVWKLAEQSSLSLTFEIDPATGKVMPETLALSGVHRPIDIDGYHPTGPEQNFSYLKK